MDIVEKKHWKVEDGKKVGENRVAYIIYTQEEADEAGIKYVDWTKAVAGEYGLSTDGYVSKCINLKDYVHRDGYTSRYIRYPFAAQFIPMDLDRPGRKKPELLYLKRKELGVYGRVGNSKPQSWRNRSTFKRFAKLYAHQMLANCLDLAQLGNIACKAADRPARYARWLLKKDFIIEMIDKELQRILTKKNITQETVLDMIMDAAKLSKSKEQASNLLRAAEDLMDIFGMKQKNQQKETFEADAVYFSDIEKAVEIEGKKIEESKNLIEGTVEKDTKPAERVAENTV